MRSRRLIWFLALVCLLACCDPVRVGPAAVPASVAVPQVPSTTPPLPSLPPSPQPTNTPLPPSPIPPRRATAWWEEAVFYEVFVRSFYDSDGDGIGDLQGLIEKLDYLNDGDPTTGGDLGVTGLWLMPIFDSVSYHGYDVVDYYSVNPDYGDQEDFERLIEEAHRRGMCVIVDLVLNHTSDQHPWFLDSASGPDSARRDWYLWSEIDPGYLGPWGQQVWHPRNGAYYYGLFWEGMPDLNLENAEVTAELYDVARYCLQEMGADGFRLDAARHYIEDGRVQAHTPATHDWLRAFYLFGKGAKPDMLAVGEVWDVSDVVATYVGDQLDLAFEFSLATAILLSVNEGRVTPLESGMKEIQRLYPAGGYATFLTNHDQDRVMDKLGREPDKARLAATVLMTLPGVPFVYYGEEIGMTGSKPDELIRSPMQWSSAGQAGFTSGTPWEPVNDGYEEINVERQTIDPDSLLSTYREFITLRFAHPALRIGDFLPVQSAGRFVYSFVRYTPDEHVLVVINLGDEPATDYALAVGTSSLTAGAYTATTLPGGTEAAPLDVGQDSAFEGYQPQPELPARSALILLLAPAEE